MLLTGKLLEGRVAVPVGGDLVGGPPPTGTHSGQAPQVWRAPEGPEGTGGLRDAAPSEARSTSLAGGRGLLRLENPWSQEQHARSCWAAAHGRIEQPGKTKPRAAASSVSGRKVQGFDGGLEGGGCLLVLVRVGIFLDLAGQDAGGRGLVVRGSDGDALLDRPALDD